MSKTEFVMVPRELAQFIVDGGYCRPEKIEELRELLAKPAMHQGEPVALPARKRETGDAEYDERNGPSIEAWNACLDEIAKLGPLYTRPMQGEPVAYIEKCDVVTIAKGAPWAGTVWGRPMPKNSVLPERIPVYTHVDPSEVERLESLLRASRTSLDNCALQIENLQVHLAERDALLREWLELHRRQQQPVTLHERTEAALSASAEPSAPVEIDERAAFEKWYASRGECCYLRLQRIEEGDAMYPAEEVGNYKDLEMNTLLKAWQARAALEPPK